MALSSKAKKRFEAAMARRDVADEITAAIDATTARVAADVAAVSAANANTQTASYVQADVQSIATLANANKTAINGILTALKAAGLML